MLGDTDWIGVLKELASTYRTRIVRASVLLSGNRILTKRLKARYHDHNLEILAGDGLFVIDLEASFGQFELMKINEPPGRFGRYGEPAHKLKLPAGGLEVYTIDGKLTEAQMALCDSGALEKLLTVIVPAESEEINLSQKLVRVWLRKPSAERIRSIVDVIAGAMPHEEDRRCGLELLPEEFQPLIPLIEKWGISDDVERTEKLRRSAASTRQKLVARVVPLLPSIDRFLDTFGGMPPEHACALGDLAQAVLEAQSELEGLTAVPPPGGHDT